MVMYCELDVYSFLMLQLFTAYLYLDKTWKVLVDAAGAMIPNNDQETLTSLTKFVDQLPSVFGQVV